MCLSLNFWPYSVSRIKWLFPVTGQLCEKRGIGTTAGLQGDIDLGLENVFEDVKESRERPEKGDPSYVVEKR